jgi:hypothetical protein
VSSERLNLETTALTSQGAHARRTSTPMTGARVLGLPCQHRLALEKGRNASAHSAPKRDAHEALAGFASHDVKDN